MPKYTLTVGTTFDTAIQRLAAEHNTTVGEVLRRAVATYATLKKYPNVYVQLPANDGSTPVQSTGLRRIAIP